VLAAQGDAMMADHYYAPAVRTRFLGPRDRPDGTCEGSRIVAALVSGRRRLTVPFRSDLESSDNHARAARALIARIWPEAARRPLIRAECDARSWLWVVMPLRRHAIKEGGRG
jgi:hypothetical protein